MLLGALCLNPVVRAWVSGQLSDGSLTYLVKALEEFLKFYRKAGQGSAHGDVEGSTVRGYVERLQGLVENLQS